MMNEHKKNGGWGIDFAFPTDVERTDRQAGKLALRATKMTKTHLWMSENCVAKNRVLLSHPKAIASLGKHTHTLSERFPFFFTHHAQGIQSAFSYY